MLTQIWLGGKLLGKTFAPCPETLNGNGIFTYVHLTLKINYSCRYLEPKWPGLFWSKMTKSVFWGWNLNPQNSRVPKMGCRFSCTIWGFPKMLGFPQQPWVFLLKMIILRCEMGVPPFKETPIYQQPIAVDRIDLWSPNSKPFNCKCTLEKRRVPNHLDVRSDRIYGDRINGLVTLVEPTHLKNMLVKLGIISPGKGENKKYLKPPPRWLILG